MADKYDQLLIDLFTTALEGGINYWSGCTSYHWIKKGFKPGEDHHDYEGFRADIVDDLSGNAYHINRRIIDRGYRYAVDHPDAYAWSSEPPLTRDQILVSEGGWDFDAGDADAIVQLGLWETVQYG